MGVVSVRGKPARTVPDSGSIGPCARAVMATLDAYPVVNEANGRRLDYAYGEPAPRLNRTPSDPAG